MTNYSPMVNSFSRLFLIPGRARGDHKPQYESCTVPGELEQSLGDVTPIYCPDPQRWGRFIEVGRFRGEEERAEIELTGRYASDVRSELLKLAKSNCAADIHINIGSCSDPSVANVFDKKIILVDALLTDYSTEALGALTGENTSPVMETVEISLSNFFEVVPIGFSSQADDLVVAPVLDGLITDKGADCEDCSDTCRKIYVIVEQTPGSPGTPTELIFSTDKGLNWYAQNILEGATPINPTTIALLGDQFVVTEGADTYYAPIADVRSNNVANWTQGDSAATAIVDTHSTGTYLFLVGGTNVYGLDDATGTVQLLATAGDDLNAVHAISDTFAVAVGDTGTIVKTRNGVNFESVAGPTGSPDLTTVAVITPLYWLVGTDGGQVFITVDGGVTWTEKAFPGSGSGRVEKIAAANSSVIYLSHTTTSTRGRLLRSYDGGYSFVVLPEGSATLPLNDELPVLLTCDFDPNFVVAAGTADNATDGILLIGTD